MNRRLSGLCDHRTGERKLGERTYREWILFLGRALLFLKFTVSAGSGGIFIAGQRREPDAALFQTLLKFGPMLIHLVKITLLQNRLRLDTITALAQFQ